MVLFHLQHTVFKLILYLIWPLQGETLMFVWWMRNIVFREQKDKMLYHKSSQIWPREIVGSKPVHRFRWYMDYSINMVLFNQFLFLTIIYTLFIWCLICYLLFCVFILKLSLKLFFDNFKHAHHTVYLLSFLTLFFPHTRPVSAS
jgi:hypothetical protein